MVESGVRGGRYVGTGPKRIKEMSFREVFSKDMSKRIQRVVVN